MRRNWLFSGLGTDTWLCNRFVVLCAALALLPVLAYSDSAGKQLKAMAETIVEQCKKKELKPVSLSSNGQAYSLYFDKVSRELRKIECTEDAGKLSHYAIPGMKVAKADKITIELHDGKTLCEISRKSDVQLLCQLVMVYSYRDGKVGPCVSGYVVPGDGRIISEQGHSLSELANESRLPDSASHCVALVFSSGKKKLLKVWSSVNCGFVSEKNDVSFYNIPLAIAFRIYAGRELPHGNPKKPSK